MKRYVLLFLVALFLIGGCAKLWNRVDPLVEKSKAEYVNFTTNVETVAKQIESIDALIYKPIKGIYWDEAADTTTAAFNDLSDTDQMNLIKAEAVYLDIKAKYLKLKEDYLDIKDKAEGGYYEYQEIKAASESTESLLAYIPGAVVKIAPYLNK